MAHHPRNLTTFAKLRVKLKKFKRDYPADAKPQSIRDRYQFRVRYG